MKKVSDEYANLYHYTDWNGLHGIVKTQTIWASNIRFLNDQTELLLAKEPLTRLFLPKARELAAELVKRKQASNVEIERFGGLEGMSVDLTGKYIDSVYEVTGDDFYIVSLCGVPSNEHTRVNGLLSQWRGYGSGGGFAIVFATKELENLLEVEAKTFAYGASLIGDVIYSDDEKMFVSDFLPHFDDFAEFGVAMLRSTLLDEPQPEGSKAMTATFMCMTRFKHLGFKEEKEVRIVASPIQHTPKIVKHYEERKASLLPPKQIKFRNGRTVPVPYIELFGTGQTKLPIEKIIVGPSANKELAAIAVRKLVANTDIEVVVSDIPYV
jgi:Protein of unknown function (DUF2971)